MPWYQSSLVMFVTVLASRDPGCVSARSARIHSQANGFPSPTVAPRNDGSRFVDDPCSIADAPRSGLSQVSAWPRVRSSDTDIAAIIQEASTRSTTFRRLVHGIESTDGIVYVERGGCGHGVRACLVLSATPAGHFRILRVLLDPRPRDWEAMALIGHELQHATEVLSDRGLKGAAKIYFFYSREYPTQSDTFETIAAVQAGDDVKREVQLCARSVIKSR